MALRPLAATKSVNEIEWLLAGGFLLVAILYSSVGHAGASGYIAAMVLAGLAPEQVRPTALALNILVGGIGLFRFWRNGHVRWRSVLPLVITSAPAAFFAAQIKLPRDSYELLLGGVLLVAAAGVWRSARRAEADDEAWTPRPLPWLPALLAGAIIGTLSGLTGTGGAIFLTPLLLFLHWARTRDASGISVAFVWINSVLGLAGVWKATSMLPTALPWWLLVVGIGALIGTQLGIHKLPVRGLRYALTAVLLIAAGKLLLA